MTSLRVFVTFLAIGLASRATAAPSCTDEIAGLERWLGVVKADAASGAILSARVQDLVAIPLQKGTAPEHSAMTLVVDKDGLHDGNQPARQVGEAAALIHANRSLVFARSNPEALARGIIVHAVRDAPAAWVRAAVVAAVASREQVWLVFRPTDAKIAKPAPSPITKDLDALGPSDTQSLAGIVMREFGACAGLMDMLTKLGEIESARIGIMIDATPRALATCQCKPSVDNVASILWKLAFQDLGELVAVPAKKARAHPWGAAKATWGGVAPAVVKALSR